MFDKIRSKKDAKLYFKYQDIGLDLGKLKTILIRKGYISHIEGDRFVEDRKLPSVNELVEILDTK